MSATAVHFTGVPTAEQEVPVHVISVEELRTAGTVASRPLRQWSLAGHGKPDEQGWVALSLLDVDAECHIGDQIATHQNRVELLVAVEGEGTVTIGEDKFTLKAGEVAWIPPGMGHRLDTHGPMLTYLIQCWVPPVDGAGS